MGIIRWFKRLLGLAPGEPAGVQPSAVSPGRRPAISAADILQRVQRLQTANAQWPEIWETLNPDGDAVTQQLLVELRGPYMFAPHVALNVLEIGCQRAM